MSYYAIRIRVSAKETVIDIILTPPPPPPPPPPLSCIIIIIITSAPLSEMNSPVTVRVTDGDETHLLPDNRYLQIMKLSKFLNWFDTECAHPHSNKMLPSEGYELWR